MQTGKGAGEQTLIISIAYVGLPSPSEKRWGTQHCFCLNSLEIVPTQLTCFRYNLKWLL